MPQDQHVFPMLAYEDGLAALDWLCAAFGFHVGTKFIDNGRLTHGELITENGGIIMIAAPTPAYQSPNRHKQTCEAAAEWLKVPWVVNGVLVHVADIDAHHARAEAHGAHMLGPAETGFPGRRYRCEDLEGQRWMFLQAEG